MNKNINIDGKNYEVTNEEQIHIDDELVFEIQNSKDDTPTYVIGMFDDLLGLPVKHIWKIKK